MDSSPINNAENEMDQKEEECLRTVYKMMEDDVALKPMRKYCTDSFMLMSIRSYQNDVTSVFRVIKYLQLYSTEVYPDLFSCVNLAKLKPVLDKQIFQFVKTFSDDSPGIIMLKIRRWKPSEVSPDELIAVGIAYIYHLAMTSLNVQKNGVIVIVDTSGFGFGHARQISYDLTKKIMYCLTFASPIRILGYVAINSHMLFEKMYNVMKFVIPERARKDIHIVKADLSPLYKMVPSKELLPVCLGGEVPDDLGFLEGIEEAVMKDSSLQNLIADVQKECKVKNTSC